MKKGTRDLSGLLNDFNSNLSLTIVDYLCHQLDSHGLERNTQILRVSVDDAMQAISDDFTISILQWQENFANAVFNPTSKQKSGTPRVKPAASASSTTVPSKTSTKKGRPRVPPLNLQAGMSSKHPPPSTQSACSQLAKDAARNKVSLADKLTQRGNTEGGLIETRRYVAVDPCFTPCFTSIAPGA